MKKNLKKGFTLTELVVVIVIIGILAAVLIPTLTSYITRSRKSAAEQEANARLQEVAAYILDGDNENWFQWNEFVKKSTIAVKSAHDYYVYFVNGELKQNLTATANPSNVTVLSFSGSTYTIAVYSGDNSKLHKFYNFDSTRVPYADQGFIKIGTDGSVIFASSAA